MRPPICVKCDLELRVKKNAAGLETMTADGPYQYFHADLWCCPGCEFEILAGFCARPIVEHFMPHYEEYVAHERTITPVFCAWLNPREKQKYEERAATVGQTG